MSNDSDTAKGGFTVDDDRLWKKLDDIAEGLNTLSHAFAKFQENVEGRLIRMEEKHDELRIEQEHAKQSRSKAFDKIDTLNAATRDEFIEIKREMQEMKNAPAAQALEKDRDNNKIVRQEVIKKAVNLGIGILLITIFFFGSRFILKDISVIMPKPPIEIADE